METGMSEVDEGFRVDTPEQAAWAMRKYRSLAQKAAKNEELAKAEKNRIDLWLDRVNESIWGNMEFFERHLEAYAMKERSAGKKSVDLPDGKISTRSVAPKVLLDKSTFLQWALEHDRQDLLRTTYSPDMDAINDSVVTDGAKVIDPETGEVIPGAEATPGSVSVKISPDLDAIDLEGLDDDVID